MDEYTCSISGAEAPEDSVVDDAGDDELGSLPVGWTEITVRTRALNPRRVQIDEAKKALTEQQLSQVPGDQRELARATVELLVDAQFAAMEATVPRYLTDEDVLHVSPDHLKAALASLGVAEED